MGDGMSEAARMRKERIERLMRELEYEVIRGVMEREIEPDIHLSKTFPCPGVGVGTAHIDFHVYPTNRYHGFSNERQPNIRLVE